MDKYESLLPTHNRTAQPPDDSLRGPVFQMSLAHHLRAARHALYTAYELVEPSGTAVASSQLKEVVRCQPQAALCIFVSCALIGLNLLCTRLEPLIPRSTLLGTYLLATTLLDWLGRLAWTNVSCAFDRSIQLRAARQGRHISVMDRRALSKSESFDSWGHTFFFKFVPTTVSLILVSAGTFLISCLALATVVGLRQVTTYLGFSTTIHVLEKKDIRNETFKSLDHVGLEKAQSEFAAARAGRITGCLLRQGILASVIFGVCIAQSWRASASEGVVVGMIFKDILSLDTHVEKLSKSWNAPRQMLELSKNIP